MFLDCENPISKPKCKWQFQREMIDNISPKISGQPAGERHVQRGDWDVPWVWHRLLFAGHHSPSLLAAEGELSMWWGILGGECECCRSVDLHQCIFRSDHFANFRQQYLAEKHHNYLWWRPALKKLPSEYKQLPSIRWLNNFRQSSSHCPGRPLPLDNSRSCCKFQCSIRTVWSLEL